MKKVLSDFKNLNREISAISSLVLLIFFAVSARIILIIYKRELCELRNYYGIFGATISALLVIRIANRLIYHYNLVRIDDRRKDIVRITHHLIVVITSLKNRTNYMRLLFKRKNAPTVAITNNAKAIINNFNIFFDREIYQYINSNSIELIDKMSGCIAGLSIFIEGYEEKLNSKNSNMLSVVIPSFKDIDNSLEKLIEDLNEFEGHVRNLPSKGGQIFILDK